MRVHINAGGREVTIECGDTNVSPKDIAAEALAVWGATAGSATGAGPAYGFVTAERGPQPNGYTRYMGEGKPVPVHAVEG